MARWSLVLLSALLLASSASAVDAPLCAACHHSVQLPAELAARHPAEVHVLPHTAFFWPDWHEAELKALFRESSKGARAMAKELLAARLAAIFKAVNDDGSGSVTRAELRAKLEADAELQTLLGKSGAWALYVLKQLDASGDGVRSGAHSGAHRGTHEETIVPSVHN